MVGTQRKKTGSMFCLLLLVHVYLGNIFYLYIPQSTTFTVFYFNSFKKSTSFTQLLLQLYIKMFIHIKNLEKGTKKGKKTEKGMRIHRLDNLATTKLISGKTFFTSST